MSGAIAGLGISPQAMTGASMRMPPTQKMGNLFSQIDTSGTGSIKQTQFTQAFNTLNPPASFKAAGASTVFAALDPNGTGSVSKQDFISGMTKLMSQLRQQHATPAQAPLPTQTLNASQNALSALGTNVNTTA
jgi:Ca2+-binding EF-hand superfamily protein